MKLYHCKKCGTFIGSFNCCDVLCPTCRRKETYLTKEEVIAKLQDIRARAWYHHSQFDDDRDFEVDRAVEDIVSLIDTEIGKLKENKYDG